MGQIATPSTVGINIPQNLITTKKKKKISSMAGNEIISQKMRAQVKEVSRTTISNTGKRSPKLAKMTIGSRTHQIKISISRVNLSKVRMTVTIWKMNSQRVRKTTMLKL